MNHYETLGVPVDATPEEIKKAYRAKARMTHPDTGADPAAFTPIATAYEVLSDPNRRLLYDSTGEDDRPPVDAEVQRVLLDCFQQAVAKIAEGQDIVIVDSIRQSIRISASQIPHDIRKLEKRKNRIIIKREKIKVKNPGFINLVHMIMDGEIRQIDGTLAELAYRSEVWKNCLIELEKYSEVVDPVARFHERSPFVYR